MSPEYNNVNLEDGSESLFEMYFLLKYLNNTSVVSTDRDTKKGLDGYNVLEDFKYENILESRRDEFENFKVPKNTSLLPQACYWFEDDKKVAYIP